ncbi:hypothetical protein KKG83_05240 [Candidatus Micrarchaeota archaeon]|nr:hypothetical protein [Candidatus Micrarchaeota archaeon]
MNKAFIQKHKPEIVILGIVILVVVVLVVAVAFNQNIPQALMDEKYCNGENISCQFEGKRGCINTLQKDVEHDSCPPSCECNTEKNVCEMGTQPLCYPEY